MDLRHLYSRTHSPRVVPVGGPDPSAFFRLDYNEKLFAKNYKDPVLLAASSELEEKLQLALQLQSTANLGADLVANAVNDLAAHAAETLFFQPHLNLPPSLAPAILQSISDACLQTPCALLPGKIHSAEAAQNLTGFAVAVIEKNKIRTPQSIEPGDSVLGLASAGLHAAGFALVNDILKKSPLNPHDHIPELPATLAEELLRPTHNYAPAIQKLLATYQVKRIIKAMAHVHTLPASLPAMLPENLSIRLKRDAWPVPPIFTFLESHAHLHADEMLTTFNMGIGFALIVRPAFTRAILTHLRTLGEKPHFLGKVKNAASPKIEWA